MDFGITVDETLKVKLPRKLLSQQKIAKFSVDILLMGAHYLTTIKFSERPK